MGGNQAPGVPEEGRSLGSLARRALEEAPWIPDEEEKVILVRAPRRTRCFFSPNGCVVFGRKTMGTPELLDSC